jgi:general L-amino acid transport system permease protein
MTSASSTSRPPVWRDVRVLSWAFQLVVFALIALVVMWLVSNYRTNAADIGIPTNFDFLDNPANFSIPGSDFNQSQPVRDAFVIGILNTMRVAALGIVLATVLGVLVGIGRLSRNWVVRRLATVYVEVVRNLPLLVILVFVFLGVVLQVLPRIENPWTPGDVTVFSNRGIGVPWFAGNTGTGLILLGLAAAVGWWGVARWRRSVADRTGRPAHAGTYGALMFTATVVVGWIVLGYEVSTPAVAGRQIVGGMRLQPSYFALLIALVVYTASHIAEIVRGSIQAVPIGQGEAASALALGASQRMWFVVLPQAMRIAIPPLGNQYLNLIKNSSLGAGFAYFELTQIAQITQANGSPAIPAFSLALGFYVVLSLVTSAVVNVANRRFELVVR